MSYPFLFSLQLFCGCVQHYTIATTGGCSHFGRIMRTDIHNTLTALYLSRGVYMIAGIIRASGVFGGVH